MFTVTTDNFTYEPASRGLGESPTYLTTPDNNEGMCIELFYTTSHVPKDDHLGKRILVGAWKLTEYDRDGDDMDDYWFANFSDADAKAAELMQASYDHAELHGEA